MFLSNGQSTRLLTYLFIVRVFLYLFIYRSKHLIIYLSIYLCSYVSLIPSTFDLRNIFLSSCQSTYRSIDKCIYRIIDLSLSLSLFPSFACLLPS